MPKKKTKWVMVDDWKCAWTWISTNCMLVAAALQGAWVYIPEDLRDNLPTYLVNGLTVALLFMGVAGRLVTKKACK